jgi:GntR family transcriptional regulator/MocR family aminotransferase
VGTGNWAASVNVSVLSRQSLARTARGFSRCRHRNLRLMAKHAASLFSVDVINPDMTGRPAHARIRERIRTAIASGALAQKARLPSSRTLARDFGVARNTVDEALSQLVAEGLIVRRRGAGSFVSSPPPKPPPPLPAVRRVTKSSVFGPRISKRAKALEGYPGHYKPIQGVPFTPSLPPSDFFPRKTWKRLLSREAARSGTAYWEYGASNGLPELREAIAAHATSMRGTRASADQVVVTTSTQQAVELAAKVLADPGDSCWVETPGYQPVQHVLRAAGLEVVPVPVDRQGLNVECGCNLQPHARLAYVTPSHQYPMGYEMSLARRDALLNWAAAEDAHLVEDDYDGDYRYEGRPITSLQDMDCERVVYVASFNKILFPGLRIAYALVPEALVGAFVDAKHAADGHTALLSQGVLAAFITEGHLAQHLRTTRAIYNERRLAFLEEAQILDGLLAFEPAIGGMHVTGLFRDAGIDDRAVAAASVRRGVAVDPLSKYGVIECGGLVFGYAGASRDETRDCLKVVRRSILDMSRQRRAQ